MNLMHIKYILAIDDCGSISGAAKLLYVAQPNLSRAVREVENEYGIHIFERTTKGVMPTPEGTRFIEKIRNIQNDFDSLNKDFVNQKNEKVAFKISVPRATYIADVFSRYLKTIQDKDAISIHYCETNSIDTIQNMLQHDYDLGIIRYAKKYENYYKSLLKLRELKYEKLLEFQYMIMMSRNNPLASKEEITEEDLAGQIELIHGDTVLPNGNYIDIDGDMVENIQHNRRIYIFERGSQFEIVRNLNNAYMWTSKIPDHILKENNIVQKRCKGIEYSMRDYIIYSRKQKHEANELSDILKSYVNCYMK